MEIYRPISSAKYHDLDGKHVNIKVTFEDGEVRSTPLVVGNRTYDAVLAWVAEGNTIADAD